MEESHRERDSKIYHGTQHYSIERHLAEETAIVRPDQTPFDKNILSNSAIIFLLLDDHWHGLRLVLLALARREEVGALEREELELLGHVRPEIILILKAILLVHDAVEPLLPVGLVEHHLVVSIALPVLEADQSELNLVCNRDILEGLRPEYAFHGLGGFRLFLV